MSANPSRHSKPKATKRRNLGIFGTVLGGVLVFWLTNGLKDIYQYFFRPPQSQSYQWDGRVIDGPKKQLLENVAVSLEIRGTTFTDITDSEGRYIFNVDKSAEVFIAELKAVAQGYHAFKRQFPVASNGQLESYSLISLTPVPPNPSDPVNAMLPRPRLMDDASLPYKPRHADSAVKVSVPRFKGER